MATTWPDMGRDAARSLAVDAYEGAMEERGYPSDPNLVADIDVVEYQIREILGAYFIPNDLTYELVREARQAYEAKHG